MKTVLTIAGSDCSGGAGIQADLKTITAYGMYGMSAVTALTVQNTQGVFGVFETEERALGGQLAACFSDIRPDAVKIGMLPSNIAVLVVAEALRKYRPERVVLDPVLVSTSGQRLMEPEAVRTAQRELYPLATLLTPNVPEAEVLLGTGERDGGSGDLADGFGNPGGSGSLPHGFRGRIGSRGDMEAAAQALSEKFHTAVLIKGGHLSGGADDCLFCGGRRTWFPGERLERKNSHGTGCTLSSAIACGLAMGWGAEQAVSRAKWYLTEALRAEPGLGNGNWPLNHCFGIAEGFGREKT